MKNQLKLILLLILIIIFFIYLIFKDKGIKEYLELKKDYDKLVLENKKLEEENKKLITTIQKLKSDIKYIEKIAREKYNMVEKNEIIIKIKNKEIKEGGKK